MGNINTMLTLDGESEFKRQLSLINNSLKTLGKELTATSTALTTQADKMKQQTAVSNNYSRQLEYLTNKENLLKSALAGADKTMAENYKKLSDAKIAYQRTGTQIESARKVVENMTNTYGKNSQQVKLAEAELKKLETEQRKQRTAIATAEKALDRSVNAYHKYKQQLADTRTEINKVNKAQQDLTGTTKTLKHPIAELVKSCKDLKTATAPAVEKLKQFNTSIGKMSLKGAELGFKAITAEINLGVKGLEAYVKGLGAAAGAVGGFAVKTGLSFEQEMSKVKAYSGASAEEIQLLTEAAKEMGATTSKTATEAASALGYLSLNGIKTTDMLQMLPSVVKASEAGTMDLATVANLTARSLTAYGKDASEASDFLNILVAAQNNSSTSLYDLLTAYSDMAGTFKSLGIDMKESATILGVFANQGTSGAEAATALSSVMLRLVGSNKKASAALESIGVSAWDDQENFRGLTTVLRDLGHALEDMTPEKETLIEAQIGGVMRIQELKKLVDGVMNEEKYDSVFQPIDDAVKNQTLFTTAETMMDNLKGRVDLLTSALSGLGLSIYDTFSGGATNSVENLTKWTNILDEGVKSGNLTSMIDSIRAVGNRMSGELSRGITQGAKVLPGNLKIFNTVVKEGFKLGIQGLHESKDTILPELLTGFTDLSTDIVSYLPGLATDITDSSVTLFGGLLDGLDQVVQKMEQEGTIDKIITKICTSLEENGPRFLQTGFNIVGNIAGSIVDNLDQLTGTGLKLLTGLADDINNSFPKALDKIREIITNLGNTLTDKDSLAKLATTAFDIMENLGKFLFENLPSFVAKVPDIIEGLYAAICTKENEDKMRRSGEYLGAALVDAFRYTVKNILFDAGPRMLARTVMANNGLDYQQQDTFFDIMDLIEENKHSSAKIKVRPDANVVGTTEKNIVQNVNVSGNTINGYTDLYKMAEDMASAIKEVQDGGGRGK